MITVRHEPAPASDPVEVVERKGLGHPDTLAERLSVAYSWHCLQQYGAGLHHNLDKLYPRRGHCRIGLGDFDMTDPVTLTIGGSPPAQPCVCQAAMAARAPRRMNGPIGMVRAWSAPRVTRSTQIQPAASRNARNAPTSSGRQPIQPNAPPTLAASLTSFLN